MRCRNCGWQNPDGANKCEKCNAPLQGSMVENVVEASRSSAPAENLRSTLRENVAFPDAPSASPAPSVAEQQCPRCGYVMAPEMATCPACGSPRQGVHATPQTPVQQPYKPEQPSYKPEHPHVQTCRKCGMPLSPGAHFCANCGTPLRMGTINAWDQPDQDFCTLRIIPWTGEGVDYNPVTYSGKIITLNRQNTDPNNQSITSQVQAVLTHEGDSWFIEDRSENHSTMIRVSQKTKLKRGDIIALGNRLFEFND